MNWRAGVVLIAASALLPATATAQSQVATRIAELRAFSGAFWQTMPRVSSACRGVVNDTLHALAEQYIVMGADIPYHKVVEQVTLTLSVTPKLNAPDVMSNLEWAECRELVFHGLGNRQLTRQEIPGRRRAEAEEAERQRNRAAFEARQHERRAEMEHYFEEQERKRLRALEARKAWNLELQREKQARAERYEEKKRKNAEARQRMMEEGERQKQEREQAKAEKRRRLEERRRQVDAEHHANREAKRRRIEETRRRLNSGG